MKYFPVMGQCTAFVASVLSKIGFRNIESIERKDNGVYISTKYDTEKKEQVTYRLSIEVNKVYVGPPKTDTDGTERNNDI
jgi:hypothetical protein